MENQIDEAEKNQIILSLNGTFLQLFYSVCYLHNYGAFKLLLQAIKSDATLKTEKAFHAAGALVLVLWLFKQLIMC